MDCRPAPACVCPGGRAAHLRGQQVCGSEELTWRNASRQSMLCSRATLPSHATLRLPRTGERQAGGHSSSLHRRQGRSVRALPLCAAQVQHPVLRGGAKSRERRAGWYAGTTQRRMLGAAAHQAGLAPSFCMQACVPPAAVQCHCPTAPSHSKGIMSFAAIPCA